jgi:hypothetical protein
VIEGGVGWIFDAKKQPFCAAGLAAGRMAAVGGG